MTILQTAPAGMKVTDRAHPGDDAGVLRGLLRGSAAMARLVAVQYSNPPIACEPIDCGPVMVLPGFMMSDFHTRLLRRTLRSCGVRSEGWGLGINIGSGDRHMRRLARRIQSLSDESGCKVNLVGWSLGGLYAAELAHWTPDTISLVVTLGTPFSHRRGDRRGRKAPVHTVACWSPRDGIVPPRSAAGWEEDVHERVQLDCTHTELVTDPGALRAITALLRTHGVEPSPGR